MCSVDKGALCLGWFGGGGDGQECWVKGYVDYVRFLKGESVREIPGNYIVHLYKYNLREHVLI